VKRKDGAEYHQTGAVTTKGVKRTGYIKITYSKVSDVYVYIYTCEYFL